MQTYFISSNDTGVGKTYVGCLLVKALIRNGVTLVVKKPIESGCRVIGDELIAEDVKCYQSALGNHASRETINTYRFEPPISPERAIQLAGGQVTIKDVVKACKPIHPPKVLLVEGAGGIYSPLCSNGLNADLAARLKARILLVVPDRLGCINQTLLCLQAIQKHNLGCSAIILNQYRCEREVDMDNLSDLRRYTRIPVIAMPHEQDTSSVAMEMRRASVQILVDEIKQRI